MATNREKALEAALSKLLMHYIQQLEMDGQNKIDEYPEVIAARKVLNNE